MSGLGDVTIGIDLGTTNSVVAAVIDGKPTVIRIDGDDGIVPSCVGIDSSGALLVGHAARNQWVAAPERTVVSIKRKMGSDERVAMGDQEYTPQEVSAFILRALKARAERVLGRSVAKAVIAVPAYFTDAQRQATREAGELAGLEVLRILNEPTAAALTYRGPEAGRQRVLVYDLGGGTFDVSVVMVEQGVVEVLASTGDNQLGGDDFDRRLADRLATSLEAELKVTVADKPVLRARLQRAAEAAKIRLSSEPFVEVSEDHVGAVGDEQRHFRHELSRRDYEELIEDLLEGTMKAVTRALQDAQVRPSELDRVILVGGSTRTPRVVELLSARLGHEPHSEVDPDLAVALGAAIQAARETGAATEAVLVDITPYTFGTSAFAELYGQPYADCFVPIIRRNTRLPAIRTEAFYTRFDDQEEVDVEVFQGEDPDARKNVLLGNFRFSGLNRKPGAAEQGILVTFALSVDGVLEVHARERKTGAEIRATIDGAVGRPGARELAASRERVAQRWGGEATASTGAESPLPDDLRSTIDRARRLADSASAHDQVEFRRLIAGIEDSFQAGDEKHARDHAAELDDILFYLE